MFHRASNVRHAVEALRRVGAACGAALFLLLTISAASPALHHWLHVDGTTDATDNCAVVLFATGVTLACAAVVVSAPPALWRSMAPRSVQEIFPSPARYLLRPERGPPNC